MCQDRTLNIVNGLICEDYLPTLSDSEIEEVLRHGGVESAKRISMSQDGKEIPTAHVTLAFQFHKYQSARKVGYLNCYIRPYVGNARRCFKCTPSGHGSRACPEHTTCPRQGCGIDDKNRVPCSCHSETRRPNCNGIHSLCLRSCPRLQDGNNALRTKVNISYQEANAHVMF